MREPNESTNGVNRRSVPRLLIVMEGPNDIAFLKAISRITHESLPEVPDLVALERQGLIVMLPLLGKITASTTLQFRSIAMAEFHLYASKSPGEQRRRVPIVEALQQRPNCSAFLTWKRSFENYLHSQVVRTIHGEKVAIDDQMNVPQELARQLVNAKSRWEQLPHQHQRRLIMGAQVVMHLCRARDGFWPASGTRSGQ